MCASRCGGPAALRTLRLEEMLIVSAKISSLRLTIFGNYGTYNGNGKGSGHRNFSDGNGYGPTNFGKLDILKQ